MTSRLSCLPDEFWLAVAQEVSGYHQPAGTSFSLVDEAKAMKQCRDGKELQVEHRLAFRSVSRKFNALMLPHLYTCVTIPSERCFFAFVDLIVADASSTAPRSLGSFVRCLDLLVTEETAWDGNNPRGWTLGGLLPHLGNVQAVSFIHSEVERKDDTVALAHLNYHSVLTLLSPPLTGITLLHLTIDTHIPLLNLLRAVAPTLQDLGLVANETFRMGVAPSDHPLVTLPKLHTLFVQGEMDVRSTRLAFEFLGFLDLPSLIRLRTSMESEPTSLTDLPFFQRCGPNLVELAWVPDQGAALPLAGLLKSVKTLGLRMFDVADVEEGFGSRDAFVAVEQSMVHSPFDWPLRTETFFEVAISLPALKSVLWVSSGEDDQSWQTMLRWGESLSKKGISFDWV